MLESSIHEAGVSGKLCFPRTALGDKGSSGQNQFSLALPIYREMENINEVKETGRQKKKISDSVLNLNLFFSCWFQNNSTVLFILLWDFFSSSPSS